MDSNLSILSHPQKFHLRSSGQAPIEAKLDTAVKFIIC